MKFPLAAGVLKRLQKFPAPAEKSFTALAAAEKEKEKSFGAEAGAEKRVAIFPGCLIENFFPEAGLAAVRLLRRGGFEVEVPFDGCCGFPAANSGYAEEARREFGRVAEKILAGDYYRIITLCPTCTAMLREIGPGLRADIMLDEKKAAVFKERVRTLVSFVAEEGLRTEGAKEMPEVTGVGWEVEPAGADGILASKEISRRASKEGDRVGEEHESGLKMEPDSESGLRTEAEAAEIPEPKIKVTYHDSCHHKFVLKEERLSRELLEEAGYELAEMENADVCCGFAGVFSVEKAEISEEMLRQKLEAIEKSGAKVVAVDCPGCLLQIKGGLLAAKKSVEVRHTAELLGMGARSGTP